MEHLHDQDIEQVEYFNSVPQEEKPKEVEQVIDYTRLVYCVVSWNPKVYKQVIKKFKDEKHFNNWYDFITSKGGDVVGVDQPKEDDEMILKTKR